MLNLTKLGHFRKISKLGGDKMTVPSDRSQKQSSRTAVKDYRRVKTRVFWVFPILIDFFYDPDCSSI